VCTFAGPFEKRIGNVLYRERGATGCSLSFEEVAGCERLEMGLTMRL
jgi:hypothetical protein